MPCKIRILSEILANKIAAGEVIERPASVVKELIENAIDAGSTQIIIDVKAGGRTSIKVMDNGEGMERDDALLALERHSTSKVYSEADLLEINTMGFRGEALPSIASVSKMGLTTKTADALAGTYIYSEGGKIKEVSDAGCPPGTVVEVNSIFYNTPARRKFLKTVTTEFGHIADVISQIALTNQGIHFRLNHNDREVINTPITKNLKNRVVELLGRDVYENLYDILLREDSIKINGFISQPNFTRSTSKSIYTYINRRLIRDRVVNHAVMEAYRPFLMKNRYPIVFLFIDILPHFVDINVHPTKREVRFKEQKKVYTLIVEALHRTLKKSPWVKQGLSRSYEVHSQYTKSESQSNTIEEALIDYSPSRKDTDTSTQKEMIKYEPFLFSSLNPIGQVKETYLLCSSNEGLVIVDQHAGHERVIFEKLKNGYHKSRMVSQSLLIPQHIELSYQEARSLETHLDRLLEVGLEVEPFGGDTFIIKAVPQILVNMDYQQLILDIIDEINSYGRSFRFEESIEKILTLMACHGAIKANQRLNQDEINVLLKQLDSVGSPTNCPHGRPILRKITYQEIERMFKRS
ncbi:MAG: DNA mismatch repair endonuclease MutL [Thermodesulfobacteriota bacterium]|nr:DNA mismatch repair endonuclease MutL [Thermodesulfobacteriota bacterium]